MSLRLLATAVATLGLMAAPALAQQPAAPAAGQPAAADAAGQGSAAPAIAGLQPDWIKSCATDPQTKKEFCQIVRDLRAETGETLASVEVRQERNGRRLMMIAVPPGMQIQPGVRVVVDQNPPVPGKFTVCLPSACYVEADVTDALIGMMKQGKTLNLQLLNVQGRGVVFPIGLEDFGKIFDGAPVDPKTVQNQQEDVRKRIEKAAQDALNKAAQ
ncbi:invasion associated locus B family protein [Labrys wisconsinensis]|uniref:Invasion protein IalB n=1 Tax=Labrys wisconsinensis TaxID=425677 RepID=A0ABU0J3G0_9HYPH|nr:invasion associated locus B family protein [Labrys wisconsinensis]MDQ0468802.1 invasion protein IalB [Labrys wisconsinensis]